MKYYIIAGEASGDLHGSHLINALKSLDSLAEVRFWGGDLMAKEAGQPPIKHYKNLAFMGPWEVLKNLRTIFRNIAFCKQDILKFKPDAVVFIDYPGFNLRIAKWAKRQGLATHYYIAPQVWAWNEKRVKSMRTCIDHLYVILPFEKPFFEEQHNMPVHYVGHPLVQLISNYRSNPLPLKMEDQRPIIALLPGSRKHEVERILPVLAQVAHRFPDYRFVIAGMTIFSEQFYKMLAGKDIEVVFDQTYDLLAQAKAALVASGTSTLETALFRVPQAVCYITSSVSYHLMKWAIRVKFISLVNLIMDREVIKELIQGNCTPQTLEVNLRKLLDQPEVVLHSYKQLYDRLEKTNASQEVAQRIFKNLS